MTADLAAQIRDDLDYRRGKLVDPDDTFAEIAYEEMRDALLAVLDACAPDAPPPNGCGCDGDLKLWIQTVIAEKLGIEATETAAERLQREGCTHDFEPIPDRAPEIRCRKCTVIVGENGPRFDEEV